MIPFVPEVDSSRPLRILCLGAHSDDIEIGCGGTMLALARSGRELHVRWVVLSGERTRAEEAADSAEYWLADVARKEIALHGFRDGFFPDEWARIKEVFERIKADFDPDLVFTHYGKDMHQDHRIASELTWNTFRNHTILEYEIPKYDGDLRAPNVFVPLSAKTAVEKSGALMRFFNSQGIKHWFCEELFMGLMRLRGVESCSPSGYAEGFYSRKLVISATI